MLLRKLAGGLCASLFVFPVTLAAQADAIVSAPVATVTLDQAIRMAETNNPAFVSARADQQTDQLDRSIARAGLLPSATFHNQYLFTQGNGSSDRIGQTTTSAAPRFIANNAVHEYASEGVLNETLGLQQLSAVTLADANAAKSAAEFEIARRGLVSTIVTLYFSVSASQAKLAAMQHAVDDANDFLKETEEREQGREAAHADVVKAQLQQQQRTRDFSDAKLAASKAKLELGVLLYADPRTDFQTEAATAPALPDRATVESDAGRNNAELKSAIASLHASDAQVTSAKAAYLPDLALNFTYGIDAPQFAVNGPDGSRNLGYSASATLDIPVWDWLATEHKVKQSEIRRDVAKATLTSTQRRLIANLAEYYDEAAAARDQIASLDASVATAQESLRLSELRYKGGEAPVTEVVDAQNALIAARTAQADGIVRYQVALADLQTLTGRL